MHIITLCQLNKDTQNVAKENQKPHRPVGATLLNDSILQDINKEEVLHILSTLCVTEYTPDHCGQVNDGIQAKKPKNEKQMLFNVLFLYKCISINETRLNC